MIEVKTFLQEIKDLIKTGKVRESELFLDSIAETVRKQKVVTSGQREVVDRIKRGDQRSFTSRSGHRKSRWS